MEVCDCVECRKAQIEAVHIDTLPYSPPKPTKGEAAMNALDEILLHEHKNAMRRFPSYVEFLERFEPHLRVAKGLEYQRRRYAIGARRRHQEIWAAIRAHK